MTVKTEKVVKSLSDLERKNGRSPSIQEVADYMEVSTATIHKHLKRAKEANLIDQRGGQFMTLEMARAIDSLKGVGG